MTQQPPPPVGTLWLLFCLRYKDWGIPRWLSGKESTCQCKRCTSHIFDPWVWEDPLEREMATHSSILAWRILWTEMPGRLQSIGLQRVRQDWVTKHISMKAETKPPCSYSLHYYWCRILSRPSVSLRWDQGWFSSLYDAHSSKQSSVWHQLWHPGLQFHRVTHIDPPQGRSPPLSKDPLVEQVTESDLPSDFPISATNKEATGRGLIANGQVKEFLQKVTASHWNLCHSSPWGLKELDTTVTEKQEKQYQLWVHWNQRFGKSGFKFKLKIIYVFQMPPPKKKLKLQKDKNI